MASGEGAASRGRRLLMNTVRPSSASSNGFTWVLRWKTLDRHNTQSTPERARAGRCSPSTRGADSRGRNRKAESAWICQVREEGSGTRAGRPQSVRIRPVVLLNQIADAALQESPDRPAILCGTRRLTYSMFVTAADHLAADLVRRGCRN